MRQQEQRKQNYQEKQSPCHDVTVALEKCLSVNGPLNSEACIQEKLIRKECLAKLFCPNEARRFYRDEIARSPNAGAGGNNFYGGGGVSCSTVLQRFAFPENELLVSHETSKDKMMRRACRSRVHDLSNCMSKHNKLWSK